MILAVSPWDVYMYGEIAVFFYKLTFLKCDKYSSTLHIPRHCLMC